MKIYTEGFKDNYAYSVERRKYVLTEAFTL